MSLKRVTDARLGWLGGPFFPQAIDDLNWALTNLRNFNGAMLDDLFVSLNGYEGMSKAQTSDGYYWFWAFTFSRRAHSAIVCVPVFQDWDAADGTTMDRSCAIYGEA